MAKKAKQRPDGEATCRSCGEEILWVVLYAGAQPGGRRHPLDTAPALGGLIQRYKGDDGSWRARALSPSARRGRRLYVSHTKTCRVAREIDDI